MGIFKGIRVYLVIFTFQPVFYLSVGYLSCYCRFQLSFVVRFGFPFVKSVSYSPFPTYSCSYCTFICIFIDVYLSCYFVIKIRYFFSLFPCFFYSFLYFFRQVWVIRIKTVGGRFPLLLLCPASRLLSSKYLSIYQLQISSISR